MVWEVWEECLVVWEVFPVCFNNKIYSHLANFMELFKDPEVAAAMQNPKMMAILQDIMKNPGNVSKYMGDPDFMTLYSKILSKMQQ